MITNADGSSWRVVLMDHVGDPGADVNGRIDITSLVTVLEWHDASPISAKITINARGGKFMNAAPIIKKWDRIYLEITDVFSVVNFTVVHVQIREKKRLPGKGVQLVLTCPHQSSNLMTRTISAPNVARLLSNGSGNAAMVDALNEINSNNGTSDPTIVNIGTFTPNGKKGNDLDLTLANDYTFESIRFQEVIDIILTKEGDVVENGGAFQFHYFRFQSNYNYSTHTNLDQVYPQIFPQGYHYHGGVFDSIPTVTIKKNQLGSSPSNYQNTDSNIEPERATNLIAIGNKNAGTYPKDLSVYQGQKDTFNSIQLYDSTKTYQINALVYVISGGVKSYYKAIIAVPISTPPPNATYWNTYAFTPTVDYSPLTKQKAQYWINAGGGWNNAGTMGKEVAVVDPNVIIHGGKHFRTWVDGVVVNGSAKLSDLDALGILDNVPVSHAPFDGLRVLMNGLGSDLFAGNDPTGIPYSNNVIEYRQNSQGAAGWYVFRQHQVDDETYDFRTGDCYVYNPGDTNTVVFGDGSIQAINSSITNILAYVLGPIIGYIVNALNSSGGARLGGWQKGAYASITIGGTGEFGVFQPGWAFECAHPVKHDTSNTVELGNEGILPNDDTGNNSSVYANFISSGVSTDKNPAFREMFMGLNFAFPWPRNGNGIPYQVGSEPKVGEKIWHRVFDMTNLYLDHTGGRTWFGPNVEDFYPIQGFNLIELIQDTLGIGVFNPKGNYKMAIWFADRQDHVIQIEYQHGFNNNSETHDASIGNAKVYYGRHGIGGFLPVHDYELNDIFDFRQVIRGGIYCLDYYTDQGVYNIEKIVTDRVAHTAGKLHFSVDAFHMIKPLVATNNTNAGSLPSRNIEPLKIQAPQIFSYAQLSNMVKSLEKVYNFEPHDYTVETKLRNDLQFGDPAYYTDSELIDVTTDGFVNTEKCVVDGITYTISKTTDGPGGMKRSLRLITRIWPT